MENKIDRYLAGLGADVQVFLDNNIYSGFRRPFVLKELRESPVTKIFRPQSRAFITIFNGNFEDSIDKKDRVWESGLWDVGQRWEAELRLPYWYYEE